MGDYNQTKSNLADEYIMTSSSTFPQAIRTFSDKCDAVISTNNLEHFEDRIETLNAIPDSVKSHGKFCIAFSCQKLCVSPIEEAH